MRLNATKKNNTDNQHGNANRKRYLKTLLVYAIYAQLRYHQTGSLHTRTQNTTMLSLKNKFSV